MEKLALDYIESGDRLPLDNGSQPFEDILLELHKLETQLLNEAGAGAYLGDGKNLAKQVKHIVALVDNVLCEAMAAEDVDGFVEVYRSGVLDHHRLYFDPESFD